MPIFMLYAGILIIILLTFTYLIGYFNKDYSLLDLVWPLTFSIVSGVLFTLYFTEGKTLGIAQRFAFYLPLLWGIRQSYFLYKRRQKKHLKSYFDYRINQKPTQGFFKQFLRVIIPSSFVIYLILMPSTLLFAYPVENGSGFGNTIMAVSLVLWVFGFIFQVVSDQQMRNFMHRPEMKGRVLKTGLWKHTRHPNYFGEILMWFAISLFAFVSIQPLINALVFLSPVFVVGILLFYSGVPLNEMPDDHYEYKLYKDQVSTIIPFPRKKKDA